LLRALARGPVSFVYLDVSKEASLENTKKRHQPGSWFNKDMDEEMIERFRADQSYDEIVEALRSVAPEKVHSFSSVSEALDFLMNWPESASTIQAADPKRRAALAI
jgi:hypothetical protein